MYLQRPEVRYAGHGFDYMHGYSSTDFTDYTVYADNSKLVEPDTAPSLLIEKEFEMPKMDGAEACYPLYSAFAKAVYKDIGKIEEAFKDDLNNYGDYCAHNGKIVTFTNTVVGFERLINCDVDLFFGARPSKSQLQDALDKKVQLNITPIGKEAFVFFVEEDNPIDSLTADQLRAIYHGDIENWKELGGNKAPIVAFQRPENSGSQTMMQYFMGKVELKQPMTYEMVGGMGGVIREVAQYANERGAIGYSFRYFVEGLSQEKGVKLLAVDGVYPTVENIENGSYPLTVDLCLITRKDDPNKNVGRMIDFILSPSGQEIIRKTGYAGLPEKSN
ncbi:MAG: substrate-binding domain-containing protein [Clostridia bacterium]|nr:substrate-binding domain-containing protein [Clostridia bacterium]